MKPAPIRLMTLVGDDDHIRFALETGGWFDGTVEQVNMLLTALGYAKIAVRRNLMSRTRYIEAKDTPVYLSPAAETYWSM